MTMRPTSVCRTSLVLLAALLCTSIALSQVQIANPTNGQTVRGMINITSSKSDANNGWVSYKIEGPQQSGDFATAVVTPFAYRWDTNLRDIEGKATFPDGEYTVTAVAHLPSGKTAGQDSVRVTLANELSPSEKPSSVKLQTDYKRHREMNVQAEGSTRAKLVEHEDLHQQIIEMFSGSLEAEWRERAMSNSAGSSAIVRLYPEKGYHSFSGYKPTNLRGVGDVFTTVVMPDATVKRMHKGDPVFDVGELWLELPDRTLRQGSTWRSPMYVKPMLRADRRRVTANHRLDGFQWVGAYKCARIVSQYSENDVKLKLHMGDTDAPAGGGMGDPGGMTAPRMNAMSGMMGMVENLLAGDPEAAMGAPGMFPGGPEMAGPGGAAGGAAAHATGEAEIETSYSGVRISYFAYELGQFIRSEDIITHKMTVDGTQFSGGMSGAGGGMMDPGMMGAGMMGAGMMGPGMDPGMMGAPMDPGMVPPGDPGMMGPDAPGAFPGQGGMGGQRQVEQVDPEFKAEASVKLTVLKGS